MNPSATVAACGEFELIARLEQALGGASRATLGIELAIGDDAAVWLPTPGARALISTDSLTQGVHFRLDWTTWSDLGHKALAVNLSDIAAMGGRPRLAVVSLGLSGSEPVDGLVNCYRSMGALAASYGVAVVGGDVVASPGRMGIHVTMVGETWPAVAGRVLTRGGARPGDMIAVSGMLGLAAAGVEALRLGQRDAEAGPWIAAHARPQPAVALGRILVEAGATAAMDVSDGLYGDLAKVCARAAVSARLWLDRLPVPLALRERFPATWLDLATRGGEDYCLVFTASPATMGTISARCAAAGLETPTVIGEILQLTPDRPALVGRDVEGREVAIEPGAFEHFPRP